MSRDSEKAIKAAMKYLNEHATGDESEEELNDLLKELLIIIVSYMMIMLSLRLMIILRWLKRRILMRKN